MSHKQRLSELSSSFGDIDTQIKILEGRRIELQQRAVDLEGKVNRCKQLDRSYDRLQRFFQHMGTEEQAKLQKWVEEIITYGLQSVLGAEYAFRVSQPEIKNNEVAISFSVVDSSGQPRDPFNEQGGGVSDVLAFLLRFVLVHLLGDRIAQIILLDEPFKHLSAQHRPRMAQLLRELTAKTQVKIVMVTHDPLYVEAADKVYRFSKPEKITEVEDIA